MNKIILGLIFVFITLIGIASVSAYDVDNCTVDDFQQADLENVSAFDDDLVVHVNSVDLENVSVDDSQQDLENNISTKDLNSNGMVNSSVRDNMSINKYVFFRNSTFACGDSTWGNVTEDGGKIGNESNELENSSNFFKKAFKKVKNACSSVVDGVGDFFSGIGHSIKDGFETGGEYIQKAIEFIDFLADCPQMILEVLDYACVIINSVQNGLS